MMEEWRERLNRIVDERFGGNWSELARVAEMNPSTLHRLKTDADPRLGTLTRVARAAEISVGYLVDGTEVAGQSEWRERALRAEQMLRESASSSVRVGETDKGGDGEELLMRLNFRELSLLSENGERALAWTVLGTIASRHPHPLRKRDIAEMMGLGMDSRRLERVLLVLTKERKIITVGGEHRLASLATPMSSSGPTDRAEHAKAALETLAMEIVPAVDAPSPRGVLVKATTYVPAGHGTRVVRQILAGLRTAWEQIADRDQAGAEEVTMVFGAAATRED